MRIFILIVSALLSCCCGPALAGSGGDSVDVAGWMDRLDWNWGGDWKIRGRASWPSDDSPYGAVGTRTYMDADTEGRLKSEWRLDDLLAFETHYEIVLSGGETRKKTVELQQFFPGVSTDRYLRGRIPEDDRRLFDLTSVISDRDDRILYHRLDRLSLTYRPSWGTVRVGRQAVTWGNGLLFNPMDLFNPFSPADIERDYKLGDDMVSIQAPVFDSSNIQVLYVPRRDPDNGDASWDHSSLAAKQHFFAGEIEMDLMAARHYEDWVLGAGAVGYLGGAAWRIDLTGTFLDSKSPSSDFFSLTANIDYSWVWIDKNFYGFLEFFYSGIGENDYEKALQNPDIVERIDRGELFTLGRAYLGANARMELHPLFNVFVTAITNLRDPSGLLQPRATYDVGQNTQLLLGANVVWGPRGSEFGGVKIPGTDFTTEAADAVYLWWSYYF